MWWDEELIAKLNGEFLGEKIVQDIKAVDISFLEEYGGVWT